MRKNLFSISMFIFGLVFITLTIVYACVDTEMLKFLGALCSGASLMLLTFILGLASWKGKDKK